jgi:hypothetical protein
MESIAIASAAATELTTTTAVATGALFARAGDVDGERATIQLLSVQTIDRLLGFLGRTHGHETKPARAIGGAIHHQIRFGDRAERGERVLQIVFGGVEGKISDKQFTVHVMLFIYCLTDYCFHRLFPTIGTKIITEPGSLD